MEGIVLLVPGLVVTLAYLVQPLVSEDPDAPWDRTDGYGNHSDAGEEQSSTPQPAAEAVDRRAMTDGGRVCHNCGSLVEGDYLYCAECLMPRV